MAKLESTLKNMILSLTLICLVAAGLLAAIYLVTKDPIDKAKEEAILAAQTEVLNGQEGQAIQVEANGFGGPIKVMVGVAPDGTVLGYKVLEHSETPGLGDNCGTWFKDPDHPGSYIIGKKAPFSVSKDGGNIDAITAATISSRAFLKAIDEACDQATHTQAASGATELQENAPAEDSLNVELANMED